MTAPPSAPTPGAPSGVPAGPITDPAAGPPAPRPGRRRPSATLLALGAFVLGVSLGAAASATGSPALAAVVRAVEPLGALWVNAIRMTIIPLVVSLLVTSVAGVADVRSVGRLGARSVALFLGLLTLSALVAALAGPPLFDRLPLDPAGAAALRERAAAAAAAAGQARPELPTLRGFVVGLVPTNPVHAAAEGAMLPLIVFTVLFAAAVTRLPAEPRGSLTGFFRAVSQAMLVLVGWVLRFTPVGVFALAAATGLELGLGAAGAVGYYVVVTCGLVAVVALACYPVAMLLGRIPLRTFARAVAPAQAVAVSSRSSLASLPALIAGSRAAFGHRPQLEGFVLPLAVSTFKLNTPVADLAGPLFLAQLYGVALTPGQIATMTLVAVAMSFSNPGIPSGGLFVVTAPVMLVAGLPLDGIGLLIAADAIPDVFNTLVNVTGDMTVAAALAPDAPLDAAPDLAPDSRRTSPARHRVAGSGPVEHAGRGPPRLQLAREPRAQLLHRRPPVHVLGAAEAGALLVARLLVHVERAVRVPAGEHALAAGGEAMRDELDRQVAAREQVGRERAPRVVEQQRVVVAPAVDGMMGATTRPNG
jgi:Na+/H+-dicarboxylate symporter